MKRETHTHIHKDTHTPPHRVKGWRDARQNVMIWPVIMMVISQHLAVP